MAARVWEHKFVMEVKAALIEAGYGVEYHPDAGTMKTVLDGKIVFAAIQIVRHDKRMEDFRIDNQPKGGKQAPWICQIVPGLIEGVG